MGFKTHLKRNLKIRTYLAGDNEDEDDGRGGSRRRSAAAAASRNPLDERAEGEGGDDACGWG